MDAGWVVLCRSSTLSLPTLSSHIDKALDLVLLDYAGEVDTVSEHHSLLMSLT